METIEKTPFSQAIFAFCNQFKTLKATVQPGIHPWWSQPFSDRALLDKSIKLLEVLLIQNPKAQIGECGLDASIKKNISLELQEEVLTTQLELAQKYKRNVNLHCVKTTHRLQILVSKFPSLQYTLHSYKGSQESTLIWIKLGAHFSLGKRSFDWTQLANLPHPQRRTLETLQNLYLTQPHCLSFESDAPDGGDASTAPKLFQTWEATLPIQKNDVPT